jgi:hypothetical protein
MIFTRIMDVAKAPALRRAAVDGKAAVLAELSAISDSGSIGSSRIEYIFDTLADMSIPDKLLAVALYGTAMHYAAERRNLAESIAELRKIANGRDDILAEAAGIQVGSWYAWPSTHAGYELVAAGMLIMAAGQDGRPLDYEALEHWTRVGYEQGMRSRKGSAEAALPREGRWPP